MSAERPAATAAKVYVTATIEVALYEEDDPLTQAEIEDLVSGGPSSWSDWNVLNVGLKRNDPRSRGSRDGRADRRRSHRQGRIVSGNAAWGQQ